MHHYTFPIITNISETHATLVRTALCCSPRLSHCGMALRSTWRLRLLCWLTYTHTLPSGLAVAQLTSFRACCACDSQPHRPVALPLAIVAYKRTSLGCARARRFMVIYQGHSEWGLNGRITYLRQHRSESANLGIYTGMREDDIQSYMAKRVLTACITRRPGLAAWRVVACCEVSSAGRH